MITRIALYATSIALWLSLTNLIASSGKSQTGNPPHGDANQGVVMGRLTSTDVEKLKAFIAEAFAIYVELAKVGGALSQYSDEESLADMETLVRKVLSGTSVRDLRYVEADLVESMRDLRGELRHRIDARLFAKSGMVLAQSRSEAIIRGQQILVSGTVRSTEEYADLDIYWNILKDDNDPRAFQVEQFMGRFAHLYD
jgi:hypothetical protein